MATVQLPPIIPVILRTGASLSAPCPGPLFGHTPPTTDYSTRLLPLLLDRLQHVTHLRVRVLFASHITGRLRTR